MSAAALEDWRRLERTSFFPRLVAERRIVATELEDGAPPDGYAASVRHESVPFVSYPYEWCFGMLRDAALFQLELLRDALREDMTLKDASPYNVQWRGVRPLFVDVGSFAPLRPGEPWEGYRQFCSLYLNPLLLQARRGVPFNARLRGSLDGIPPAECRSLLRPRDLLRRGPLTHVLLHSRLERRHADRRRDVRGELRDAGFGKALIEANVRGLERLVRRLRWEPDRSGWAAYGAAATYDEADAARKAAFVERAAAVRRRRLVWDLGCNDGRYTRIAAAHADTTVALDSDAGVVELLYRELVREDAMAILPLVVDVADPSPALGWRGRERRPLWERGRPDLVLCLALVHHLVLAANVPLAELLDWLRSLDAELVVEFVGPEDPMAARLLAAKAEGLHAGYGRTEFERLLEERFEVGAVEELANGARVLYAAAPRE